jgi:hypothetical protein
VPALAAAAGARPGPAERMAVEVMYMSFCDLVKATVVCGGLALLVYSFPVLSQAVIIAVLTLMWFSCAHQVIWKPRH